MRHVLLFGAGRLRRDRPAARHHRYPVIQLNCMSIGRAGQDLRGKVQGHFILRIEPREPERRRHVGGPRRCAATWSEEFRPPSYAWVRYYNTRLLALERVADDCGLAGAGLADLVRPGRSADDRPAPGLEFGEPRVTALLQAQCLFALIPEGIANRRSRPLVAQLLGLRHDQYASQEMGYDLRRLARKGLIRGVAGKLCYQLTPHATLWLPVAGC